MYEYSHQVGKIKAVDILMSVQVRFPTKWVYCRLKKTDGFQKFWILEFQMRDWGVICVVFSRPATPWAFLWWAERSVREHWSQGELSLDLVLTHISCETLGRHIGSRGIRRVPLTSGEGAWTAGKKGWEGNQSLGNRMGSKLLKSTAEQQWQQKHHNWTSSST